MDPVNGRKELALISHELIEGTDAAAGANDRDQIAGRYLFVGEFPQGVAHAHRTFGGKAQVIHDDRYRPGLATAE
jgi:hypothetical protein